MKSGVSSPPYSGVLAECQVTTHYRVRHVQTRMADHTISAGSCIEHVYNSLDRCHYRKNETFLSLQVYDIILPTDCRQAPSLTLYVNMETIHLGFPVKRQCMLGLP